MSQIKSSSISVFPCANRGKFGDTNFNLQSRLTSEYNLTSIINHIIQYKWLLLQDRHHRKCYRRVFKFRQLVCFYSIENNECSWFWRHD